MYNGALFWNPTVREQYSCTWAAWGACRAFALCARAFVLFGVHRGKLGRLRSRAGEAEEKTPPTAASRSYLWVLSHSTPLPTWSLLLP